MLFLTRSKYNEKNVIRNDAWSTMRRRMRRRMRRSNRRNACVDACVHCYLDRVGVVKYKIISLIESVHFH